MHSQSNLDSLKTWGDCFLIFHAVVLQNEEQPNPAKDTNGTGIFNLGDADLIFATNAIKTNFVSRIFI
jgi:hypothetical protein